MSIVSQIINIAIAFVNEFGPPELVEFSNNAMKLRLKNPSNKSIGFLYGYIHNLTKTLPIKEFNATNTTLEQIFNSFAKD